MHTGKKFDFGLIGLTVFLFGLWGIVLNIDFGADFRQHAEAAAFQMREILRVGVDTWVASGNTVPRPMVYPGWHFLFLGVYCTLEWIVTRLFHLPITNRFILGKSVSVNFMCDLSLRITDSTLLVIVFLLTAAVFKRYFHFQKRQSYLYAVVMMFVGPLYCPLINSSYFLGQFSPNPWHNPTSFAIKPLSILLFFFYCYLYRQRTCPDSLRVQINAKTLFSRENLLFVLFAFGLWFSAFMKPNFYQTFVPALFVFCVIDFFVTRFKSFWFCFKTALAVLPVCLQALRQYTGAFTEQGNGVVFDPFLVWDIYSRHKLGSFLLSLAFPIAALICFYSSKNKKVLRDPSVGLSVLTFLSAFVQYCLLALAQNPEYNDFAWGVFLAVFNLFIVFTGFLVSATPPRKTFWAHAAKILLALHFVCGLGYFVIAAITNTYVL